MSNELRTYVTKTGNLRVTSFVGGERWIILGIDEKYVQLIRPQMEDLIEVLQSRLDDAPEYKATSKSLDLTVYPDGSTERDDDE